MRIYVGCVAAASLLLQLGCSSTDPEPTGPAGCPEENVLGGVCVGVPAEPLCGDNVCTVNATCSTIREVVDQAGLDAAVGAATAGDCIALHPGSYVAALLPPSVSLLGRSVDEVRIDSVQINGGSGALVQGMSVGAEGIRLDGATDVTIRAVRINSTTADGIEANAGSSLSVYNSEVHGALRYALSAFDANEVLVEGSILNGASGPGMWAQCTGGCDCTTTVNVTMNDTIIRDTKIVGLSLVGASATLRNVEISGNTVDDHFQPGGGLSVSQCSTVDAVGLYVRDNSNFGILVDDSSVNFGEPGSTTIEVLRNLRGIWVQNIGASMPQTVLLTGCEVGENDGVGIGVDGASTNVTIRESTIRDTAIIDLPVLIGGVSAGAEAVGDGVNWFSVSQVVIDGLSVSNSARASVLIDGEVAAGSSIDNVTLGDGDDIKGILQQNFAGGEQPAVGTGAPSVTTSAVEEFHIAQPPAIPPGI